MTATANPHAPASATDPGARQQARARLALCPTCRGSSYRCRCLYDIKDPPAFVHATIRRARLVLTRDELDELHAAGMALLYQLAKRYKPQMAGHQQEGRFSGYAAMYLPRKLGDAWHAMHPEHQHVTDPDSGKRRWEYREKAVSLEALTADDPDRHSILAGAGIGGDLEGRLRTALIARSRSEVEWVVKVAKRVGSGEAPAKVAEALELDEDTVRRHMRTIVRAQPDPRHQFAKVSELRAALERSAQRDAERAARVGKLLGDGATFSDVAEILTRDLHAAGELEDWDQVDTGEVRDHADSIRRVIHMIESEDA